MHTYKFKIIPGTKRIFLEELEEKFSSNYSVVSEGDSFIEVASEVDNIDDFRTLLSPLYVTKNNTLTRNLFRRSWRNKTIAASINPALAFVLCKLANITENDVVYDPFCGAGTIAVTAAKYFSAKKVLASDLSGTSIEHTLDNFKSAGIKQNNYSVFRSNISQVKMQNESIDKVITNLPFGIRVGSHESNLKIYKTLAAKAKSFLKTGGVCVLFTQEKTLVLDCFLKQDFKKVVEFDIKQGGLTPGVYVFRK